MTKVYPMGQMIQETRKRRNLTQTQLCQGLCSISTLSRIEDGVQTPNAMLLDTLMQELGMFASAYNLLVSDKEFERLRIATLIRASVARHNYDISDLLEKFKNCTDVKMDKLEKQFFLLFKSIEMSENHHAPAEEVLILLTEALRLTLRHFDLKDNIENKMLSIEELMILNNIALEEYRISGFQERAIKRMYFLKEYFETKIIDPSEKARQYPAILVNLANWEEDRKNFQTELSLAEEGIAVCRKFGKLACRDALILCKGVALGYLGRHDEAKKSLRQALAIKAAKGVNVEVYRKNIQATLGYDFSDFLAEIM